MNNKRINFILAASVFFIAEIVYVLTVAPTTSFWDCSEFITCANQLEVGHAPGAPVFMLLGRVFSFLAGGNSANVALTINLLSATASAFTVMFLFLIITWFVKKALQSSVKEYSLKIYWLMVYGAAFVGALTYAFTDSFWFSAVEGEVYATSSLFSAMVFWCILKWEETKTNDWRETRWIFLIFFLLGISVGIHLLNMLALPAIALVVYSKFKNKSVKRLLVSQALAILLMVLFVFVIIPGVAKGAAYSDLFFVNILGARVYLGAVFYIVLVAVGLRYAYGYFKKNGRIVATTILLAFCFWLVGYSSFAVLVIRSNANPFVDINNVENLFGLVDYLNREQYPMRPLFKGNNFNSPIVDSEKRYTYKFYDGKYHQDELNPEYIFDKNTLTLFPRMASLDPAHEQFYRKWVDIKGRKVKITEPNGNAKTIVVPTFIDNVKFFIRYQIGHMYFRYFMWNFSGKQNDIQGLGNNYHGNWISGIGAVDNALLGAQTDLPEKYGKHKARNKYFLIPLIVGLIGMVYHYKTNRINFSVVMLLFLLSGIAIAVYLNEVPITPRERDYAYVGSFFAFCIWIGLGVLAIMRFVFGKTKNTHAVILVLLLCLCAVPLNMLKENWNDHTRSGRSIARDFAENNLKALAPNSILFTYGDNDTYPIWYMQEVEGVRKDVRHILHTFLPIDWYANQLHFEYPQKGNVPISYKGCELLMNRNSYFPIVPKINTTQPLSDVIAFVRNADARSKVMLSNNEKVDYVPTQNLSLKVNKEAVVQSCAYLSDTSLLPESIEFTLKGRHLTRGELLTLDILMQNDWRRPVYFSNPSALNAIGLGDYVHAEGNVFRFLPFKRYLPQEGRRELALIQYKQWQTNKWGGIKNNGVYLDHTCMNNISNARYYKFAANLAEQLMQMGEQQKALEVLDMVSTELPYRQVGASVFISNYLQMYFRLGEIEKANNLANKVMDDSLQLLSYYGFSEGSDFMRTRETEFQMYLVLEVVKVLELYSPVLFEQYNPIIQQYYSYFTTA